MLKFTDVYVEYPNGTMALENFNLEIKKGEIVAIVGESGSGKTTAIRAAIGLIAGGGEVVGGDITFNSKSLVGISAKEWQNIRGKDMTMIFQDSGSMLNPIRTIGSQFVEFILVHSKMSKTKISKAEAWQKGSQMLELMGLYDGEAIMKSIPSQLSGGMRQRVGIAFSLTFKPEIILADEPTSALDVTIQAQIIKQLMELRDEFQTSILIVTHNLGVAAYMADKIVVMCDGKIVETGDRDQILNHPQEAYTKSLLEAVPDMGGKRYV